MNLSLRFLKIAFGLLIMLPMAKSVLGQSDVSLNDLSFFQEAGPSWKIVSDVRADLHTDGVLTTSKGVGILVNLPDKKNPGKDLISTAQYGDLDLELDYLMAKGSNSGIYLQGRYEVQLFDSWSVVRPRAGDNGGIYERWDDSKPEGQRGYEGYAPRQNVSRAPGLWQHLKISFQAPRFDATGKKIDNARMLLIELNGVIIHESIELFGPTRGAIGNEEALGPLRIQGDHGSIAFRNIKITSYNKTRPRIHDLNYELFKGTFTKKPDFSSQKPEQNGVVTMLGEGIVSNENEFAVRYKGTFTVNEPGEYNFTMSAIGGGALLKIGDMEVIPFKEWQSRGKISLQVGSFPFEIVYSKYVDWSSAAIGLIISGPGIREYLATDKNLSSGNQVDPILVNETDSKLLRSFMDLPGGHRLVHAVSVGHPDKLHYTYDMDNGAIAQIWRGEFLDATPMWHSRGDGSSRPVGTVLRFGKPAPAVTKLTSLQTQWRADTTGSTFRAKGYSLNPNGDPTFRYTAFGASIEDFSEIVDHGRSISRTLIIKNPQQNFYVRLAVAKEIEQLSDTLYLIGDKSYYLRIDDSGNMKPVVRDSDGQKEIIIPIQNKVTYSIIF
jgi:hypothetical protein